MAENAQRHDLYEDYGYSYMGEDDLGEWVKYTDHESALSALREEVDELRNVLNLALLHRHSPLKWAAAARAALTPKEQGNG